MNTWTINKLIQSSARLKSWRGNWANYRDLGTQVGEVKFTPFVGTKSCLVTAEYIGVSQAPKHHNVNLFFEQCEILTEAPTDSSWRRDYFAVNYNGQIYYIKNLSASRNPVRIRCSCADFYYRWAWSDYYQGNCLYGPSPKVYRPVAGSNRGPVNPNNIIGICKHVLGTVKGLEQKGIIKY